VVKLIDQTGVVVFEGTIEGAASTFNGGTITDGLVVDAATPTPQGYAEEVLGANLGLLVQSELVVAENDDQTGALFDVKPSSVDVPGAVPLRLEDAAGNRVLYLDMSEGFVVKAQTGETVLRAQLDGTVYMGFNFTAHVLPGGAYVTSQHAAPADADLFAGECALWFDQTNGAAKLMVKAKQADGAVKTAAIALA